MKSLLLILMVSISVLPGCTNMPKDVVSRGNGLNSNPSWNPSFNWDIQTTPGTYDVPESIVFLEVEGLRIPVADGPGLEPMTSEQRIQFRVPKTAEWAASGYYAGFGVNLIAERKNDSLVVSRAIWDEQADPALGWTYAPQAQLALLDLRERVESVGSELRACYSGSKGTTTSKFQLDIDHGIVKASHDRSIADPAMGYFTSAQSEGEGLRVGNTVFVSFVTQVEYDVLKAVEIWTLSSDGLIFEDFLYPSCPKD